jgi:DNA-binding NtrC family response regulator
MTMCMERPTVHVIREILVDLTCAVRCDARVLITGESAAGKKELAELIHRGSPRSGHRFLTLECASMSDTELEGRLFGRARTSVSGPDRDTRGLLEQADGGTIFLGDVGSIGVALQARLLHFLETRQIRRVGADRPHMTADVRLISSADSALFAQAEVGAFSADLYYRLNVVQLTMPPPQRQPPSASC